MPRSKASLASNPIRLARESQGKTLQEFSDKCGIHLQALYLNESGVYPEVLPAIMNCLVRMGLEAETVNSDYFTFVQAQRDQFFEKYAPYRLPEPFLGQSPVARWRETLGLSRLGLAKSLCIHPAQLHRVESKRAQQLPSQLVEALKAVQFSDDLIEELNDRIDEYYFS